MKRPLDRYIWASYFLAYQGMGLPAARYSGAVNDTHDNYEHGPLACVETPAVAYSFAANPGNTRM